MTAKLVKTEAVVEGRTEVRWTVVEDDDTPEIDDGSATHPIGDPTPRITARARTTGTARFTVDVALPGLLEAAVLRSPHANAKVTSLDLDAARAVPGVRCVLGPGDGPDNGDSPLSNAPDFAGGAIAAVAADSADAADAALEALAPQFEVLGFVSGIDEAFEKQDFLIDPTEHVRGDTAAALAAAEVTVEAEYLAPAQLHNSMEPHAAVADWREDGLTLWSSTQAIYDARATVAEAFGLDPERVRVICEFMGGGFGSKFGVGPAGDPRGRALAPHAPPGAAREQPPGGEHRGGVPDAGADAVHDRRVARRAPPGGRGVRGHRDGHRRLGLPGPRAGEVGLRLPQPAPDGRARPPEPRPVGRLPRTRSHGGHVRLRAGARRAGREGRHRPARAAAPEPLRERPGERQALHVEAPARVLRPGGRAGRLGGARRAPR